MLRCQHLEHMAVSSFPLKLQLSLRSPHFRINMVSGKSFRKNLILGYSQTMRRHFLIRQVYYGQQRAKVRLYNHNCMYKNVIEPRTVYADCIFLCLCELTLLDHCRASSCSCRAATIMGSLSTSPAFCSGNSSSFSSGGGGRGGGTSPSGKGGLGGACSSLTWKIHINTDTQVNYYQDQLRDNYNSVHEKHA